MRHPAWIAADVVDAVSKTRGQIIDWADEIERGLTTALDDRDARIAELEAQLAEANATIDKNFYGSLDAVQHFIERTEKAEADAARLREALEKCDKIATQEPTTGRLMRLEIIAITQAALRPAEQSAGSEVNNA